MKTPLSSDDQILLCTVMVLDNVLNETTIVLKATNCKEQRRILCQSQVHSKLLLNKNKKNGLPVVLKKIGHTAVLRLTQDSPLLFTISRL
jgi:hypothetical protein